MRGARRAELRSVWQWRSPELGRRAHAREAASQESRRPLRPIASPLSQQPPPGTRAPHRRGAWSRAHTSGSPRPRARNAGHRRAGHVQAHSSSTRRAAPALASPPHVRRREPGRRCAGPRVPSPPPRACAAPDAPTAEGACVCGVCGERAVEQQSGACGRGALPVEGRATASPRPPRSLSPAGRARSTAAAATASGEGGWGGGWGLAAASCARGVAGAGRRRPEPLATHVVRLPARRAARLRRGRVRERQRGVRRIGGGQVGSSECRAEHRGEEERRGVGLARPRVPQCLQATSSFRGRSLTNASP